jgi:hypothetical protein
MQLTIYGLFYLSGKSSIKKFISGKKYQIFMATKVMKTFVNPGHSKSEVFFYLTRSKKVEEVSPESVPMTGKSFIVSK